MKPIGIITAMPAEARSLVGRPVGPNTQTACACGHVTAAGVGTARAAAAAEQSIDSGARALLSWGTAGALDPDLRAGALVIPTVVADPDGNAYDAAASWHAAALTAFAGMSPASGKLLSVDAPVHTGADKARLAASTRAVAVDMESAAVARIACQHGIPFLAVRAIVDPAGFSLPDASLSALWPDGRVNYLGFARKFIRRPQQLNAVLRLSTYYRAAMRSLRNAARLLDSTAFLFDP